MKKNLTKVKFAFFAFLLIFVGCGDSALSNAQPKAGKSFEIDAKTFPPLPSPAQTVEKGIVVYKVRLNKMDDASDVWIYLPEKQTNEKFPAVLITAAGSYLWNGTSLDEGDQPEHLPYVRSGYAVIAYETPGSLVKVDLDKISERQLETAVTDFKNSRAGLAQAQNALNYVSAKVSSIDTERIYAAGHSSAATHSLLVAATEPRVKAAVAYAPAVDVEKRLEPVIGLFNQMLPGYRDFIAQSSPKNNISKIKIPVFIFHAKDDSVISIEDTKNFVAELQKVNPNVTFVTAETGEHYYSMIQQGIPKAIEWLNKISSVNQAK